MHELFLVPGSNEPSDLRGPEGVEAGRRLDRDSGRRIAFAHTLRGAACLFVVIFHLVLFFGGMPQIVARLTGLGHAPPVSRPLHAVAANPLLNFGGMGVALFFLISGMVIPLSLGRLDRSSFLIARLFRLVPTYACCLGLTILGAWAAHAWFGAPYQIPWRAALAHVALIRDLLSCPPIDGVVWSLEIEAKYYLLCIVFAPLLRRADVRGILMWSVAVAVLVVSVGKVPPRWASENAGFCATVHSLQLSAVCMSFLWMGTIICLHHVGRCSTRQTTVAILLLDAAFAAQCLRSGVWGGESLRMIVSFQLALAIFVLVYRTPQLVARIPGLNRLADISYSLYVLHGSLGYTAETVLYERTGSLSLSIAGGIATMIGLASLVHRFVERPTQTFGKWLSQRWMLRRSRAASANDQPPSPADHDWEPARRAA
jgi:peptidoglycan/LPS O-acetylase OafA/YrhL